MSYDFHLGDKQYDNIQFHCSTKIFGEADINELILQTGESYSFGQFHPFDLSIYDLSLTGAEAYTSIKSICFFCADLV